MGALITSARETAQEIDGENEKMFNDSVVALQSLAEDRKALF